MVILIAIVIVGIVAFAVAAMVQHDDPFSSTAKALDLTLTRSVPELIPHLEGFVAGLPIRVDITHRRNPAIRYRVFYPALGLGLRLTRESSITRTVGRLGHPDAQLGERAFDDAFLVQTSRPDALREFLTPKRRRALLELVAAYPDVVIEDGGITLVGNSTEPSRETLATTLTDLSRAAAAMAEGPPPPPSPASDAAVPHPAPQPAPEVDVAEPTPADSTTAEPPPAAPQPVAATPEPGPPDTGLPTDFFDRAFGADRLSFESSGVFTDEFQGRTVRLHGELKQARELTEDPDFPDSVGTKAVVAVATVSSELYGENEIDAIVHFPGRAVDHLTRGDTLTFSGTLEKVDPFMRNLYVTDGRLVGD
jgi:hypothetical protein